eukprot:m51a1_g12866 hypothetical protein (392) ;mRNA; f:175-1597
MEPPSQAPPASDPPAAAAPAPRVAVLGACGGVGSACCRVLLDALPAARLLLLGRCPDRCRALCEQLRGSHGAGRVDWASADAGDAESLVSAVRGCRVLVVASRTHDVAETPVRAAIAAGADYVDFYPYDATYDRIAALDAEARAHGRVVAVGAGYHPGLPGALVRAAAAATGPTAQRVAVGVAMSFKGGRPEQLQELFEVIPQMRCALYRNGQWEDTYAGPELGFERGFGRRGTVPLYLPELEGLPAELRLREVGTYVASTNKLSDYVVMPLLFALGAVKPGLVSDTLARLLLWGDEHLDPGVDGVSIVAEGCSDTGGIPGSGARIAVGSPNAYHMTAACGAALAVQLVEGRGARVPGVQRAALALDPQTLLENLARCGLDVGLTTGVRTF